MDNDQNRSGKFAIRHLNSELKKYGVKYPFWIIREGIFGKQLQFVQTKAIIFTTCRINKDFQDSFL